MKRSFTVLLAILILLTSCSSRNKSRETQTPDEILQDGLEKIIDQHIDDEETAEQLAAIYQIQYDDIQILISNRYNSQTKQMVADRNVSQVDLKNFFAEMDRLRVEILKRSFQMEEEKAELLGSEVYRAVIKKEESVFKDYLKAVVEEQI